MSGGTPSTFLFADLAGFTALTEAHGDAEAAELAEDFSRRVGELLPDHDADQVKEIGDAVMLRAPAADQAVQLGLRVVHDVGRRHGFPAVRVGMHTGPAVERRGDWFGTTVNLAARVAGAASGCEVLLTEATKRAAEVLTGITLRDRAKRCAPQIARCALPNTSRYGAPALPEVLNLSSARRDRGAKPFPLWGLAALSYL